MRAECCKYEFSESRALQKLSLEELSIVNVNFMGAEQSVNVNFMRAEICKCELYEG
jgi:hypothetical protein